MPTLANWLGLQMPRLPFDGFDASATWLHREAAPAKPVLYFTPEANGSIHCIRSGPWKLRIAQSDGQIYINDRPGSTANYLLAKPEVYNLDADSSEAYDVAHAHPDLVPQLSAEIETEISTLFGSDSAPFRTLGANNQVSQPTARILLGLSSPNFSGKRIRREQGRIGIWEKSWR